MFILVFVSFYAVNSSYAPGNYDEAMLNIFKKQTKVAYTGWSKKVPYFVFTPKPVFQKFLLYFSGGVHSRSRKLF